MSEILSRAFFLLAFPATTPLSPERRNDEREKVLNALAASAFRDAAGVLADAYEERGQVMLANELRGGTTEIVEGMKRREFDYARAIAALAALVDESHPPEVHGGQATATVCFNGAVVMNRATAVLSVRTLPSPQGSYDAIVSKTDPIAHLIVSGVRIESTAWSSPIYEVSVVRPNGSYEMLADFTNTMHTSGLVGGRERWVFQARRYDHYEGAQVSRDPRIPEREMSSTDFGALLRERLALYERNMSFDQQAQQLMAAVQAGMLTPEEARALIQREHESGPCVARRLAFPAVGEHVDAMCRLRAGHDGPHDFFESGNDPIFEPAYRTIGGGPIRITPIGTAVEHASSGASVEVHIPSVAFTTPVRCSARTELGPTLAAQAIRGEIARSEQCLGVEGHDGEHESASGERWQ